MCPAIKIHWDVPQMLEKTNKYHVYLSTRVEKENKERGENASEIMKRNRRREWNYHLVYVSFGFNNENRTRLQGKRRKKAEK